MGNGLTALGKKYNYSIIKPPRLSTYIKKFFNNNIINIGSEKLNVFHIINTMYDIDEFIIKNVYDENNIYENTINFIYKNHEIIMKIEIYYDKDYYLLLLRYKGNIDIYNEAKQLLLYKLFPNRIAFSI